MHTGAALRAVVLGALLAGAWGLSGIGGTALAATTDGEQTVRNQYIAFQKDNNESNDNPPTGYHHEQRTITDTDGNKYTKDLYVRNGYTVEIIQDKKRFPEAGENFIISVHKVDPNADETGLLQTDTTASYTTDGTTIHGETLRHVDVGAYGGAVNTATVAVTHTNEFMIQVGGEYVNDANHFMAVNKDDQGKYYIGEGNDKQYVDHHDLYVVDGKLGTFTTTTNGKTTLYTGEVYGQNNEILMTAKDDATGKYYSYWGAEIVDEDAPLKFTQRTFNDFATRVWKNDYILQGADVNHMTVDSDNQTIGLMTNDQLDDNGNTIKNSAKPIPGAIKVISTGGTDGQDVAINFSNDANSQGFSVAAGSKVEGNKKDVTGGDTLNSLTINGKNYTIDSWTAQASGEDVTPDADKKINFTGATGKVTEKGANNQEVTEDHQNIEVTKVDTDGIMNFDLANKVVIGTKNADGTYTDHPVTIDGVTGEITGLTNLEWKRMDPLGDKVTPSSPQRGSTKAVSESELADAIQNLPETIKISWNNGSAQWNGKFLENNQAELKGDSAGNKSVNSIAIGNNSIIYGSQNKLGEDGDPGTHLNEIASDNIALGANTQIGNENASVKNTKVGQPEGNIAIGSYATVGKKENNIDESIALGMGSTVESSSSVAIGAHSTATKADILTKEKYGATADSAYGIFSIGSAAGVDEFPDNENHPGVKPGPYTRRLINLSKGQVYDKSNDAINGAQLYHARNELSLNYDVADNDLNNGTVDHSKITLGQWVTYNDDGSAKLNTTPYTFQKDDPTKSGGTRITNLAYSDGTGSDAVNVDYLNNALKGISSTDYRLINGSDTVKEATDTTPTVTGYKVKDDGTVALKVQNGEDAEHAQTVTIGDIASKTQQDKNTQNIATNTTNIGNNTTEINNINGKLWNASVGGNIVTPKDTNGKKVVEFAGGEHVDVTAKDGTITFATKGLANEGLTNITDSGKTVITNIAKGVEQHIAPTTEGQSYTVDKDGNVVLNYVDGNNKDVQNQKAVISGVAKNDLTNITNDGKQVINTIANKAVKVIDGQHTTVEQGTETVDGQNVTTYKVNVAVNGSITEGDTNIVTGDTVYKAIQNVGWNAKVNGNQVKEVKKDGDLNFINGDNITISDDNGAIKISTNGLASSGDIWTPTASGKDVKPKDKKVDFAGGNHITVTGEDGKITIAAKDLADTGLTNITQAGETKITNIAKNAEQHIAPKDDYTVDADGKVTLTYVDGNGNEVKNQKAIIKDVASKTQQDKNTQNITTNATNINEINDKLWNASVGGKVVTPKDKKVEFAGSKHVDVTAKDGTITFATKGLADEGLTNITNQGKTEINNIAKDAVKVIAGTNTTVTSGTATNTAGNTITTYAVNVTADGKVEGGNTNIVTGDTVYNAIQNVGWNAKVNGNQVKEVKKDGDLNFINGDNITISDDNGAIKISTNGLASAGDIWTPTASGSDVTPVNQKVDFTGAKKDITDKDGNVVTKDHQNIVVKGTDGNITFDLADNLNLGNVTTNNITSQTVKAGDMYVTNVDKNSGDSVINKTYFEANSKNIKPTKDGEEYTIDEKGNVTMTYVDGKGDTVKDVKAVIKDVASKSAVDKLNDFAVKYDKNTDGTVNNNHVTLAGDTYNTKIVDGKVVYEGGTHITNVAYADGKNGSEAVNVDKLNDSIKNSQTDLINKGFGLTADDKNSVQKDLGEKITIKGDKNITTSVDGDAIKVALNDKVVLGSETDPSQRISLNGTEGRANIGGVVIGRPAGSDETYVTGLSNKTLDVTDFAKVGRAATEEQLKAVQDALNKQDKGNVKYATKKDDNGNDVIDYDKVEMGNGQGSPYNYDNIAQNKASGGTTITNVSYVTNVTRGSDGYDGSAAVNVDRLNDSIDAAKTEMSKNDRHLVANPDSDDGHYTVQTNKQDQNQVTLKVQGVDKNGNNTYSDVIIDNVAKDDDVGKVDGFHDDLKNKDDKGNTTHTSVVDAVNKVDDKVNDVAKKVGDTQYKHEDGSKLNVVKQDEDVTTSIGKLDEAVGKATETAKQHSSVSAGNGITVATGTNANGGVDYTVGVADDFKLGGKDGQTGSLAIKGSEGTIAASGTITAGSFQSGTVVINGKDKDGKNTNTVSGLSNTTWDPKKVDMDVKDGGYKGSTNAATESQLQQAIGGTVQYDRKDDGTVDKTHVTLNKGGDSVTITNVAKGDVSEKSTDAVNGSQLWETNQQVSQNTTNISNIAGSVSRLGTRVDRVGAGAAALAALQPLDFDPDAKWDFSAGYGNYNGANAVALGAYYRPNEDLMFSVGGSMGGGENMVNAGISVKLGAGSSHVNDSKVAMAKEIKDLRKEVETLKSMMLDSHADKALDTSKLQLFPDVPKNHWAYEYVSQLAGNGVLEGYPDSQFHGDRPMTRYEFAAMLYRAMTKGAVLSDRILTEFAPELERFTVDTIETDTNGNPTIQRVRVARKG